jgi:hypothetical protein
LTKIGKGDLIKEFQDDDTFFLDTFDSEGKSAGWVRIGLGIFPSEMATANPVGGGRSEPNHSPFLPPPVGRISFTLNPLTLFVSIMKICLTTYIVRNGWTSNEMEDLQIHVLCLVLYIVCGFIANDYQ